MTTGRGGRRVQIRTRCLILGKTRFSRLNHSTLTVTRVIVKPQLDISGSTECSFTNKKTTVRRGLSVDPRGQLRQAEALELPRAVCVGGKGTGGACGQRRLAPGRRARRGGTEARRRGSSRECSLPTRINPSSRVHERRTGVSGAQRGAGTERQGRRATPRAACANGRSESRVRSVFALGRTGAREGAGETMGVFLRAVAGHARKRSSPAAPPARLP